MAGTQEELHRSAIPMNWNGEMLLWHSEQQLKTSLKKKKKAFQTQELPKTLPFPWPHKMYQKCSDNRAWLTQIWKTTLQFPFFDKVVS